MSEVDDILDVGDRFIAALEACDQNTVRDLYSENARLWHNLDQQTQSVDDNIKTLVWMHTKLSNMKYDIVSRERLPDGFVQRHVLRGSLANGDDFAMPACAVIKVENGKIVSIDEYLDSKHVAPLK